MAITYSANATITARVQSTFTRTDEIAPTRDKVDKVYNLELASGVDENQIDVITRETRHAGGAGGPSAYQTIYFATGFGSAITDPFGRSLQFANVRSLIIHNRSSDPADMLTVQESSFAPIPDGVQIPPGGVLLISHPGAGWDVVEECSIMLANSNPLDHPFEIDFVAVGIAL